MAKFIGIISAALLITACANAVSERAVALMHGHAAATDATIAAAR